MKKKIQQLEQIYADFENQGMEYRQGQACEKGCSFCCRAAGSIDITTLEGLNIRNAMEKMPRARQKTLTKVFRREIKLRRAAKVSPCPFLQKNDQCMIYAARPFSCRRIYSVHTCSREHPPALSRSFMQAADLVLKKLQELDDTGYSGHLSYILYMLSKPDFLTTYLAGQFQPEAVMEFGKTHRIVINRSAR